MYLPHSVKYLSSELKDWSISQYHVKVIYIHIPVIANTRYVYSTLVETQEPVICCFALYLRVIGLFGQTNASHCSNLVSSDSIQKKIISKRSENKLGELLEIVALTIVVLKEVCCLLYAQVSLPELRILHFHRGNRYQVSRCLLYSQEA